MDKRQIIISIVLTGIFLLLGMTLSSKLSNQKKSTIAKEEKAKPTRTVEVSSFQKSASPNTIVIDGRLIPLEKIDIFSKVNGLVKSMPKPFRPGTYYKKGETICILDDREEKFNLLSQRSQLLTSITQIMPDLKFDYPDAYSKWLDYMSKFDVEKSTPPLPTTQSDQEKYFVSSKNIYNLYYNIKSAETRLNEFVIVSPISGSITSTNMNVGALVRPGASIGTMISQSDFELEAPVSLADLKYIAPGQKVSLKSEDLNQSWTGIVKRIGNKIDERTQFIPIYIGLNGSNLREGMYLNGNIVGKSISNVVALNKNFMPDQSSVFVYNDGILQKKNIKIVKTINDLVYTSDITADDKVVTGNITGLFEGQKVTIKTN